MYLGKCCTVKWLIITTVILLVILIGVNILAFVGFPAIIDSQIHKVSKINKLKLYSRIPIQTVANQIFIHYFLYFALRYA